MNEGIYKDLTSEEYHADTNSLSRSSIMTFKESPYRYWAKYISADRPKEEPTPAMIFGSAFHCMILESDKFKDEFIISPEPVLLKNVGRARYDAYKENLAECENSHRITVPWLAYVEMRNMREAMRNHPNAMQLIEGAIYEQSYFWKDEHSGLMVKSRPDILHSNMVVDLKTVNNCSERSIQNAIIEGGYHVQMAMIKDGIFKLTGQVIDNFILLCVEKEYPYSIGIFILDKEYIEYGQITCKNILLEMKECRLTGNWPDYQPQTLSLPKWISL